MQEEAMKENPGAVHAKVLVDVPSFLLSEERAEIQKLEARVKVNIVMVPNQHLETPHYKVQRLRHDELNEMEHVPSSYEMVERPEEPKAPGAETAEAKVERQQPVVKTITPSEPAPIVDESLPRPPRAQQQSRPAPQPSPIVQPVVVAAAAAPRRTAPGASAATAPNRWRSAAVPPAPDRGPAASGSRSGSASGARRRRAPPGTPQSRWPRPQSRRAW